MEPGDRDPGGTAGWGLPQEVLPLLSAMGRGVEQENGRIPVLPEENDSGPIGVVYSLAGRTPEAPQNS